MNRPFIFKSGLTAFFISLFFASAVDLCFAGAWTMPEGRAYVKLSVNAYDSDEQFDTGGNPEEYEHNGRFEDRNAGLYLEYGLRDDISIVFSGSYKFLEKKDDSTQKKFNGFSDMDIALKYRLMKFGSGVLSVQGLVKCPEAYDENEVLLPGNGQYDAEIRIMFGQSLYPFVPGYVNIEGAYRYRDEEPSDEMRFLGEFGVDFLRVFYARFKAESIAGMDNADSNYDSMNPNLSLDYDLFKLSMALGCRLTDMWGVELETIRETSGKNVSKGTTYSAAVTCLF
jgi:hypothetical protein